VAQGRGRGAPYLKYPLPRSLIIRIILINAIAFRRLLYKSKLDEELLNEVLRQLSCLRTSLPVFYFLSILF
jgi:hypothetical protein